MPVKIKLSNNDTLIVNNDTKIRAWKNGTSDPFYPTQIFNGTINDEQLSTSDERIGIQGLVARADWFSLDNSDVVYQSSSVISLNYI
ncbi:hypothetical protein [Lentilactobacillus laojiaonis]|uniref:hypothetical protein n=1 Tax=Lentilactobacillus laojiaonis TaxID=2883998 RepID=UPI001D0A965B|nr:hypothetical protein [Lentilactobacillus laojiaonis]UDM32702.1 hypothetical protein LHL71_03085 [Lentilactobacillus laojiaonis]